MASFNFMKKTIKNSKKFLVFKGECEDHFSFYCNLDKGLARVDLCEKKIEYIENIKNYRDIFQSEFSLQLTITGVFPIGRTFHDMKKFTVENKEESNVYLGGSPIICLGKELFDLDITNQKDIIDVIPLIGNKLIDLEIDTFDSVHDYLNFLKTTKGHWSDVSLYGIDFKISSLSENKENYRSKK